MIKVIYIAMFLWLLFCNQNKINRLIVSTVIVIKLISYKLTIY